MTVLRRIRGLLLATVAFAVLAPAADAATFTVDTAADVLPAGACELPPGDCSLREAIQAAEATPDLDVIRFDIGIGGQQTIPLATALPQISAPVTIDGTTQPGYGGSPLIALDGAAAGGTNGLHVVSAEPSTIRGLAVMNFDGWGIQLDSTAEAGGDHVVEASYIGLDPGGTTAAPNGNGVWAAFGSHRIGGPTAAQGNVISGNTGTGVLVTSQQGTVIQGNRIGTNAGGTGAVPNGGTGIGVGHREGTTTIGGAAVGGVGSGPGNVISGNGGWGVTIGTDIGSPQVVMRGNVVGTNASGTAAVPNGSGGIWTSGDNSSALAASIGGTAPGQGNLVSGNGGPGLRLANPGRDTLQANAIGTDAAGNVAVPNAGPGIEVAFLAVGTGPVIGAPGAGNLISGNVGHGILLGYSRPGTSVSSNLIGLARSLDPLGNGGDGVRVAAVTGLGIQSGAPIKSNRIESNDGAGVAVESEVRATEISANAMRANGGQGIDLNADGVPQGIDEDDPDGGANDGLNAPLVDAASVAGGTGRVAGRIDGPATAQSYTLELFVSTSCDGEGARFGSGFTVTTDAEGEGSFDVTGPVEGSPGDEVTATLRDAEGNTSEFSSCRAAAAGADLRVSQAAPSPAFVGEDLAFDIAVTNDGPGGATGVVLEDRPPAGTQLVFVDGGCAQDAGLVTCPIGTLAPGQTATRRIVVRPAATGPLMNQASVRSQEADPPANSSSQLSREAVPRSQPTPTPTPDPAPAPSPTPDPSPPPPRPVLGKTVNVDVVRGKVTVRLPDGRTLNLADVEQIPLGSVVNAKAGTVRLSSIGAKGRVQTAVFFAGIFRVTQTRGKRPVTQLALAERLSFAACPRRGAKASAARKKPRRRLWGKGSGAFRTSGRRSAATVRGTTWLVQDSCAGTLTRVTKGIVTVRDFGRRKTVRVRAGGRYLAR